MPSPEPRFSCTIPSLHDDTPLNVRIYHPAALQLPNGEDRWKKKGIVMAHPYAPMGGSYDDRVVGIVAEEFLRAGWIVGTFNFRGAYGSKGRTSWSGKPEVDDYLSVAGFFMHYVSYLRAHPGPDAVFTPNQSPASPIRQAAEEEEEETPIVVLGGYSYGSIILRHLPPLPSILHPFATPPPGSAPGEILLRAQKLANENNLALINAARDARRAHEGKLSITMGGEETSHEIRRSSKDFGRSVDCRRSHDLGNRLRSLSLNHGHRRRVGEPSPTSTPPEARFAIQVPHVRYLLVSPLTSPTSTVVAPGLARGFWDRGNGTADDVIVKHDTLAVYGDQDAFASARKMRAWVGRMCAEGKERFRAVEVKGAGHFWHEVGVERELRDALQKWERRVRD